MAKSKTNWPLVLFLTITIGIMIGLALSGCRPRAPKPEPKHTTTVGPHPSGSAKASIIPQDDTVEFPKNQDETNYAVTHGAKFICGDGGMSFKSIPDACVGHGGISEVVRR
jgi:hypothetical protein